MTDAGRLAELLTSRLRGLWGTAVEITGIRRVPGGASREGWSAEARTGDGAEHRLILLRDPAGAAARRDPAVEAAALVAARSAGVPAPRLYDRGEEPAGRSYLLMERLDGETIPRRLLRDEAYAAARPVLARRLGQVLAGFATSLGGGATSAERPAGARHYGMLGGRRQRRAVLPGRRKKRTARTADRPGRPRRASRLRQR